MTVPSLIWNDRKHFNLHRTQLGNQVFEACIIEDKIVYLSCPFCRNDFGNAFFVIFRAQKEQFTCGGFLLQPGT